MRWCCAEFKENAGAGKVTLIGIRHAESPRRKKRNEFEMSSHRFSGNFEEFEKWRKEKIAKKVAKLKKQYKNLNHDQFSIDKESEVKCINGKDSILVSPIIYWTEKDVWDFLNGMEIEHCGLYDMGYTRIGCILCPMANAKSKKRDEELFPHVKRNWLKVIKCIRNGTDFFGNPVAGSLTPPPIRNNTTCSQLKFSPSEGKKDPSKSQLWGMGFSGSPADSTSAQQGDNITEDEICERIYEWWISGKPYKVWYAETFLQQKMDFGE